MEGKIINIDKVADKIGLKERVEYDKIDIFLDNGNKDNVWAIVYYTEDQRKKSLPKEKIVRFKDYNEMIFFLRNHFDCYELNHQVEYRNRHIFMHNVDYNKINFYLHEGKPKQNYIELIYKEYINDGYHTRKRVLPQEYNDMLVEILKINKKMDKNAKLSWDLYQLIDVYAKKEKDDKEDKTPRISRVERREDQKKNQIPTAPKSHKIRNLVIVMSVISLSSIVSAYTLHKNMEYKKEVVTQKNATIFGKDAMISQNKEKVGTIIDNLFEGNYQEVSPDEFKLAINFIKQVGQSNFDNNGSSTSFEYKDFFTMKFYENKKYSVQEAGKISEVLERIESLYDNCFRKVGNELFLRGDSTQKYLDYVLSLTFMYDTVVDSRDSGLIKFASQDTNSQYATEEEIIAYNKCPQILKYIILSQLETVLSHTDYQVSEKPSNYFGGLDKYDLLNHVVAKTEIIHEALSSECSHNSRKGI